MKQIIRLVCLLTLIISWCGCVEPHAEFSKIPPGVWRGKLYLSPDNIPAAIDKDEVTYKLNESGELPFNFEIVYDDADQIKMIIHNAEERIKVTDIKYGRDKQTAKDTLVFNFGDYDTYISAIYEERIMEGFWVINYKDGQKIPFKATYGDNFRFKSSPSNKSLDVKGKWAITFEPDTDNSYPGVGIFAQDGNKVTGTILTETGDYRYLEGATFGDKVYLSCFDGAHAFLFEAKDLGDGQLNGIFKSGISYTAPWIGTRDEAVDLADPWMMTKATDPNKPAIFQFKNQEGKTVSTAEAPYAGKPLVIEIMGTWCPNCKDANEYLKKWSADHTDAGIKVLSIAFERYKDEAKNIAQINTYKKVTKTPWDILLGGYYNKKEAALAMPQIDQIIAYPTLLFMDKDHHIRHVYTGFSGPATPDYIKFDQKFNELVSNLSSK